MPVWALSPWKKRRGQVLAIYGLPRRHRQVCWLQLGRPPVGVECGGYDSEIPTSRRRTLELLLRHQERSASWAPSASRRRLADRLKRDRPPGRHRRGALRTLPASAMNYGIREVDFSTPADRSKPQPTRMVALSAPGGQAFGCCWTELTAIHHQGRWTSEAAFHKARCRVMLVQHRLPGVGMWAAWVCATARSSIDLVRCCLGS